MSQQRVRDWVNEFGIDGVYVSFSGGKDSTVLLDVVRSVYPEVTAVFVDTGLE
ncbi:MAG: phosphoadenosine phosphosulfate reductase family protein [Paludibacteraceae bacterium]|nr:phosphoadenosine phosphosulfate reductase family protein [Paludibacteraceae bacterium]